MPATFAFYHLWLFSISIADISGDDTLSDFGDLGKELLGGFVIAIVVASGLHLNQTTVARSKTARAVYFDQFFQGNRRSD